MTQTNIDELVAHVKLVGNNLFTNKLFMRYAQEAGDSMKEHVINNLKHGRYDYMQSYRLRRTLNTNDAEVQTTKTRALIGYGQINDLNQQTLRGPQRGIFGTPHGDREIRLRPEPELPSWIIMEFGRKSGEGASSSKIPKQFRVPYTQRDSKPYLSASESKTRHNRKPIMFMMSKDRFEEMYPDIQKTKHSGVREGRFFREGLEDAKPDIHNHLTFALYLSLKQYGGEVKIL